MRALTIIQPHAHLIAIGKKPIENRRWSTPYRGPLAIHAGKNRTWLDEDDRRLYPDMVFGAIIAVGQLVACLHKSGAMGEDAGWGQWSGLYEHEHAEGPICWVIERVRLLPTPVYVKGEQGLWYPPFIRDGEVA